MVFPLKCKEDTTITNALQEILNESNLKAKTPWVDKGGEIYNRSMKSWPQHNDIEIYSTNNEGEFFVTERFIRTLKNNIYKYITSISKIEYIGKLGDIVNKYNKTYHSTIRMKPIGVKASTYVDFNKEI